ncbi:hypothetical protein RFI_05664 [Reticulomyxa filosa]|uniref:Sugar phosphate transporter domain-containing protein n=1 Tax=Reticulomyxa filosa TaxID=46433 RepID=X6P1N2_RETFI|nr:hypothetical protein RFI_05664 [Reticulomyxa filosa]|eukprot:ETO31457.1 hypothetical protein RFI_05664 [Reticulomyxa filosa]
MIGGYWVSAILALGLNWCEIILIGEWSALTLCVTGGIKLLLILFCSWAIFNHQFTVNSLIGYVLCTLGVIGYNWSKLKGNDSYDHVGHNHAHNNPWPSRYAPGIQSSVSSILTWSGFHRRAKNTSKHSHLQSWLQVCQCCAKMHLWVGLRGKRQGKNKVFYDKVYSDFPDPYVDTTDAIELQGKMWSDAEEHDQDEAIDSSEGSLSYPQQLLERIKSNTKTFKLIALMIIFVFFRFLIYYNKNKQF